MKPNNRKPLAVFDFDKTLTVKHSFWRFLRFSLGYVRFYWLCLRFLPSLIKVARKKKNLFILREEVIEHIFKGMDGQKFKRLNTNFANKYLEGWINPEALQALKAHQAKGHQTALVSNSNELYLKVWAKKQGIDLVLGSLFEEVAGKLTGKLEKGHCFAHNKVSRLKEALGDLTEYDLHVYGDSRGDKDLLALAQQPFYQCFNTSSAVKNLVEYKEEKGDILIVGAGAVGLTLACELARHGLRFRIIEKKTKQHNQSRAFAIHSRTLEIFQFVGIQKSLLALGRKIDKGSFVFKGKPILKSDFSTLDAGHPYLISLEQYKIEQLLDQQLQAQGIQVERGVELHQISQETGLPKVALKHTDGTVEKLSPSWVIGTDGARSSVRKQLNIPFEGHHYDSSFIVVDGQVKYKYPIDAATTYLNNKGYLMLAPFPGEEYSRLVLELPHDKDEQVGETSVQEVDKLLNDFGFDGVSIGEVRWMSKSRVQRRLVPNLKVGRVLLAGDAAHIQSPVGGQGLNTGIQDAFNLGWKLAFVSKGWASEQLLFTYNDERHPKAKDVLDRTDRLHKALTIRSSARQYLRNSILKLVGKSSKAKQKLVKTVAGLQQEHCDSILSDGIFNHQESELKTGHRCPDVSLSSPSGERRLFDILRHEKMTLLIIANSDSIKQGLKADFYAFVEKHFSTAIKPILLLSEDIEDCKIPAWTDKNQNLSPKLCPSGEGLCLIRPDGYICFLQESLDFKGLIDYLLRFYSIF